MISGTSTFLSKSGPVNLLTITKMLQTIQEHMETSWTNIIVVNLGLTKILNFSKMYVLGIMSLRFPSDFLVKE